MARITARIWWTTALVGFLLVLVILVGYRMIQSRFAGQEDVGAAGEGESLFPVLVAKVIRGNLEERISMAGTVVPRAKVEVFSRVTGPIQEVGAKLGVPVKEGDVLAMVRVDDGGLVSIRSPITGIVAERSCEPGDIAIAVDGTTAKPLFTIVDTEVVKVRVGLPETLVPLLKVGREARVRVGAYPLEYYPLAIFKGTITSISPSLDVGSRTAMAEITIENRDQRLKPGMFAVVGLMTRKLEDVLLVPKEAVIAGDEFLLVHVVEGDTVHQREILAGASDDRRIQILDQGSPNPSLTGAHRWTPSFGQKSGVQEGEEVVTLGTRMVSDGQKVRVLR
jgi:multidrug efflux pump subunit AcrA (membrane-fusion protein)